MNANGDETQDDSGPAAGRWLFQGALGLLSGLILAAVGCLGYAWLRRTPDQPFVTDRGDVTAMLVRTTIVVAISTVLAGGYLVVRRLGALERRARYIAAALLALAVAGLLALRHGSTRDLFERAAGAQLGLRSVPVTTVAQEAWMCACLAVIVLAVVSAAASVDGAALRSGWAVTAAVAAVVVVVAGVVGGRAHSPLDSQTASRIDAPPTPELTGAVAYRVDTGGGATLVPAGAGFATVRARDYSSDVIDGYDGATGQRRWSFGPPNISVSGLYSTGTGPDSVVVVQASYYGKFPWPNLLIGLDATTGTPLWVKTGLLAPEAERAVAGISPAVLLVAQPVEAARSNWVALAPRTGDMLWTKTFRTHCRAGAFVVDAAVLISGCDDPPGVVAAVVDPQTGQQRGAITKPAPGSDAGFVRLDDARAGLALVSGGDTPLVIETGSQKVVSRIPAGSMAAFLDAHAVVLVDYLQQADYLPVSILDLDSGATIPTGVVVPRGGSSPAELFTRMGAQWATFLPDEQGASSGQAAGAPALRAIDAAGKTRTFPFPCQKHTSGVPELATVPGALVVNCGQSFVGIK
ncbi:hypothetical protein ACAG26_09915 [Mycobacterium sp. pUA109]|uniref:hypothetical protein n=1 Tax=Mycobacterium sp. pUA109 TaxID=3238982 RepID=UPI00351B9E58